MSVPNKAAPYDAHVRSVVVRAFVTSQAPATELSPPNLVGLFDSVCLASHSSSYR